MARGHAGLPKPTTLPEQDCAFLHNLGTLDKNKTATKRVLRMETEFRNRISTHVNSLPTEEAKFAKFNTNPFVLMFHCMRQGYRHISEIEKDILPAKLSRQWKHPQVAWLRQ